MTTFFARLYGLTPASRPMSEAFWLATVALVWCPLLALVVLTAAQAPAWLGTGPAFGDGMRVFGVLLLGVLVALTRLPPPRPLRLAALPALIVAAGVWIAM